MMKVEGHEHLMKLGGSVVNTDTTSYDAYISRRSFLAARAAQTQIQEKKINSLEAEIQDLKDLLIQVLNGQTNNKS